MGTEHEIVTTCRNGGDFSVDLLDSVSTQCVINRINPDIVYHCAAEANPKPDHTKPYEQFYRNIKTTANVIAGLPKETHINFLSSIVVYGNASSPKESYPTHATSLYGASKIACESLIQANYHTRGNTYNIFRLGAMVGTGLTHGLVHDIIYKLYSDSEELELWGEHPGSCKVFTHIDDVCMNIEPYIYPENSIINVCNCDPISVYDVASIIMNTIDIHKPIVWDRTKAWKGDNLKLCANNTKMLNYSPIELFGSKYDIKVAANENIRSN